jgi:hypothetical protein
MCVCFVTRHLKIHIFACNSHLMNNRLTVLLKTTSMTTIIAITAPRWRDYTNVNSLKIPGLVIKFWVLYKCFQQKHYIAASCCVWENVCYCSVHTIQYRHTIRYALLLHVSAYCGLHQVHTVSYTQPLFLSAIPPYTGQCSYTGSALLRYIVYVMPSCYKMY